MPVPIPDRLAVLLWFRWEGKCPNCGGEPEGFGGGLICSQDKTWDLMPMDNPAALIYAVRCWDEAGQPPLPVVKQVKGYS